MSHEAFARYGRLIEQPDAPATADGAGWRWWGEVALLESARLPYALGYLELSPAPPVFDWAERHLRSQELIVPLNGDCLVYVAPATPTAGGTAAPRRDSFQVFPLRAGQAVLLDKGVWHGAPLAVGGPAAALVILLQGSGREDTEVSRFAELRVAGPALPGPAQ